MPRQVPLPLPTPMERITELERKVRELDGKVQELEAKLAAESAIGAAVADGNQTIDRIVLAMRRQADALTGYNKHSYFVGQLVALAAEIEGTAP